MTCPVWPVYIDWDRDADEVSRGERFDEIEPMLELLENHADELPDDWPQR